jgi:hypothetical protein
MGLLDFFRRPSPERQIGECARSYLARRCPTAKVEQQGAVLWIVWEAGLQAVTWDTTELVPLVGHYARWHTEVEEHFERFLASPAAGPRAPAPKRLEPAPASPPVPSEAERLAEARQILRGHGFSGAAHSLERPRRPDEVPEELPEFSPARLSPLEVEHALGTPSTVDTLYGLVQRAPSDANKKVLADALLERGDPHGELITLELAGRSDARVLELRAALAGSSAAAIERWVHGFADATKPLVPVPLAIELFERPISRLLRIVSITYNVQVGDPQAGVDPAIRGALLMVPSACEELDVEGMGTRSQLHQLLPFPLDVLLTRCPRLRVLNAGSLPLIISHGRGTHLELLQARVANLAELFALHLPNLEALVLFAMTPALPPPSEWRTRFPRLTHLHLPGLSPDLISRGRASFRAAGIELS